MKTGVLALQGNFREHERMLALLGTETSLIRRPTELANLDALIIPGGESTTIWNLMQRTGMANAIIEHHSAGMAIYGSCAGAILLAKRIAGNQPSLSLLDIEIERNAYGRQVDSFEAPIEIKNFKKPFPGIFIRAPVIERAGSGVEILARHNGKPVMVRAGNMLATTFHPELTEDTRVHELFLKMARE